MTAHIHAENMKLYAQDAAETDKPWERWEYSNGSGKYYVECRENPTWYPSFEYRRKPRTHKVNGFEVPEPMREAPEVGSSYWVPSIDTTVLAFSCFWEGDMFDERRLERGLVHATKEAAIANAKAMIGEQP